MKKRSFIYYRWFFLIALTGVLFLINLSLGSVVIPLKEILKSVLGLSIDNSIWKDIIWDFRMTKAITCILAGSALSIGGLQMQTLFRNSLAGPDVLGLSSGASLMVSLVFMSGLINTDFLSESFSVALAASVGSTLILLIVLMLARKIKDASSLLIVGLMIGASTASLVSIIQFMSSADDLQYYLVWTFGSLGGLSWEELGILVLVVCIGGGLVLINIKSLNSWLLGDNYAKSLGINLWRAKLLMIISTSLLSGAVTAFCGPIAFVGLAVPHLIRILLKTSDHRLLLPAVALGGASLMLLCDMLAQLPGSVYVLPINTITAIVGSPVVIWIIVRGKKIYV